MGCENGFDGNRPVGADLASVLENVVFVNLILTITCDITPKRIYVNKIKKEK